MCLRLSGLILRTMVNKKAQPLSRIELSGCAFNFQDCFPTDKAVRPQGKNLFSKLKSDISVFF